MATHHTGPRERDAPTVDARHDPQPVSTASWHLEFEGAQGVQVGGANTQINHFHARPAPVSWPHRVGVVPRRADCFQHRLAVDEFADARTAVLTRVLSGLGGVGKTQLAAQYAERAWAQGDVDLLVWVAATSREAIVTGYAQAAADLAGAGAAADSDQAASRFLAWLARTDRRWLIVLDDVSDPADLRGLWPPPRPSGRVLVTTRRRDAAFTADGRQLVSVGLFSEAEATAYVTAKLAGRPHLADDIEGLARDLGYLPLALAQALAYLLDRDLTCTAYRQRLADQRRRLGELLPEPDALPDDHLSTVAVTWSLSIELADRLVPVGLARPTLELASMCDSNRIPLALFASAPSLAWLAASADDARDALHCLHRLNLVSIAPAHGTRIVGVHSLVQRVTRERLTGERADAVTQTVADALLAIWPDVERDRTLGQILRANVDALLARADARLWRRETHRVLFRAGRSLGEAGQANAAIAYWRRLHAAAGRHLGPGHRDALTARHNLADRRGEAGDLVGSVGGLAEVLADQVRVLGPDHPDTLNTRHNLIYRRGQAGDTTAAEAFGDLLADQARVLGTDHPYALATRHHLARWRGRSGDAPVAAAALEELLADQVRVLGPDHPDTLSTRHELAYVQRELGTCDPVTALDDVLADQVRVLGPDHPDTLTTRYNRARWRGEAGDPGGAASALADVLADQVRVLGPDHPDTLSTRHELAYWCGRAGDPGGGAAALAELLADQLRILGPDHPNTLTTRYSLAHWRQRAGDSMAALAALDDLIEDRLRVLRPDHRDITSIRRVKEDLLVLTASHEGHIRIPAARTRKSTGVTGSGLPRRLPAK